MILIRLFNKKTIETDKELIFYSQGIEIRENEWIHLRFNEIHSIIEIKDNDQITD